MTQMNLNDILDKISELKAVFVLGQRAVPFLEEVLYFLKEISPLMDEINASIRESTYKMPHAASQLQSVTQATELATTEILDLVEAVFARLGQVKGPVEQNLVHLDALALADAHLLDLLRTELGDAHAPVVAEAERLCEENAARRRSMAANLRIEAQVLDEIREKLNRIMISLQVQDITTQQIASVNHVIESVRERMARLVERLAIGGPEGQAGDAFEHLDPRTAFDPNARYDLAPSRQSLADEVIYAFQRPSAAGPSSQDEIDRLFGSDGSSAAAPEEIDPVVGRPDPAVPDRTDTDRTGPASQSDIDALFGGADPASQDEIDRLFGRSS